MPQKREPSGLLAAHRAQALSSRAPHESQKTSPGRTGAVQAGHFMVSPGPGSYS